MRSHVLSRMGCGPLLTNAIATPQLGQAGWSKMKAGTRDRFLELHRNTAELDKVIYAIQQSLDDLWRKRADILKAMA
jgi:hypothetical protein